MKILYILLIMAIGILCFGIGQQMYEPQVIVRDVEQDSAYREVNENDQMKLVKQAKEIKALTDELNELRITHYQLSIDYNSLFTKGFRVFKDDHELRAWLKAVRISERKYSRMTGYECDDFAIDLWKAAFKDRYLFGIHYEKYKGIPHLACSTVAGHTLMHVEPQGTGATPLLHWYMRVRGGEE